MPAPVSEAELRRTLVKACRALSDKGLVAGTDGNLSARLPSGSLLVTPSKVSKASVSEEDILLCTPDGRRIRGSGSVSSEVLLHVAAYRLRPALRAVVHAHPPTANAFSFAGAEAMLLAPVLPEVVARLGGVPTVPYFTPGSQALADAAALLLARHDAVLLAQHGAVTVGDDAWSAYLLMEKVEHLAVTLKAAAELAGSADAVRRLSPAQVDELKRTYGKRS